MGCVRCMYFSGPIVAGTFLLLGFLSFVIPYVHYEQSKLKGFIYEPPPATVIAFHWLSTVTGFIMGFSMYMTSYSLRGGIIATAISASFLLIFWICYQCFFFLSHQFQMSTSTINRDELYDMLASGIGNLPSLGVQACGRTGKWVSTGRGKSWRNVDCCAQTYVHHFQSANDETVLLDVSDKQLKKGYQIRTALEYELTDPAKAELEEIKEGAKMCILLGTGVFSPQVKIWASIAGVSGETLATWDGKVPSVVNKGAGAIASLLFCGIIYSYQVSQIPMFRQVFKKTNATLEPYVFSKACEMMGTCATN